MKVVINGFGRIGRLVLRHLADQSDVDVVAINDLADPETLVYLFRYDSVHGRVPQPSRFDNGKLRFGDRKIPMSADSDPKDAWAGIEPDVVIEATGAFRKRKDAIKHLEAGAKRVLLTAPSQDADRTIVIGVNEDEIDLDRDRIVSNASCTTNCIAPVSKVLHDAYGIESMAFTTVHAYTSSQALVDIPMRKIRRGRAAALSMIPTTTGASEALGEVIPSLQGRTHGLAIRVPVPDGSLTDMTIRLEKAPKDAEALNNTLRAAANTDRLRRILEVSDDKHVSIDIVGNPHSSIVNTDQTAQVNEATYKVLAWYDNEYGYAARVAEAARLLKS